MKKEWKRAAVLVLSLSLMTGLLAGCSQKEEEMVDAEAVVMTVNGEDVSAGLLNFAAHYVQSEYQPIYDMLYGENSFSLEVSTGYTLGDMIKEEVVDSLLQMILARQNMEEYNVSLTEEEEAAITEAAEAFLEENDEEILTKMSASQDTVEEYLSLVTILMKMDVALSADVDTEVSDEEAAQRTVRYALISADSEEDEEEEEAEEETEGETEQLSPEMEEAYEEAEQVIALMQDGMDFNDALSEVDESLSSDEVTFGADDTTALAEALLAPTEGLDDETLLTEPVETDGGYYVVYVISALDREATDNKKEEIVEDRREEAISEQIDEWEADADFTTDDEVLSTIVYDYNLEVYEEEESEWEDESDETDETEWEEET